MAGRAGQPSWWGAGALAAALVSGALSPAGARPSAPDAVTVEPPGTTTIIKDAGWSWFEDRRATFNADGGTLYASAVAGLTSADEPSGSVLLAELDLTLGGVRMVNLGGTVSDDHNSASIWVAPSGEVTTSWSNHHTGLSLFTHRRRTDGSWLALSPITTASPTTYSNLLSSTQLDGSELLYDFFRGHRFDPEVIVSPDVGRTWSSLGRLLRDPLDSASVRPYVQYRSTAADRIDFIATEGHPESQPTSVYHGFIKGGKVHRTNGTVVGALGTPVSVTALTRVWAPAGSERGWTADLVANPSTGAPTVAFSVRHSANDHRYWVANWSGTTWNAAQVAFAGGALYASQPSYTGLITLDPGNPNHLIISTNVNPVTGAAPPPSADGKVHWELWDGTRQPGGSVTWVPLTSGSTQDNLRPVMARHPNGARALLWMRGRYSSYTDYDLDVVGVVQRPDGSTVAASPLAVRAGVRAVLAPTAPRSSPARPITGQLDSHPAEDMLLYRPGAPGEQLLLGDDELHPTEVASPAVFGTYIPIPGDYDNNGTTDIYWYAPGTAVDHLWTTSPDGTFASSFPRQVNGTYLPIPGDYDNNGTTDIYWYAPGTAVDHLWTTSPDRTFTTSIPRQVNGTYLPIPGDYDNNGTTDIYWYAPGTAVDHLWTTSPDRTFTTSIPRQVNGTYLPIPGDYDNNGTTDIYWYAPGTAVDHLWTTSPDRTFTTSIPRQVNGAYSPTSGDLDGDGADDIYWYAPGTASDHLWWSEAGPLASTRVAPINP